MGWFYKEKKAVVTDERRELLKKESEEWDARQKMKVDDFKEKNPLKYKSGDMIFHWVVYKAEHCIRYWAGYGHSNNIDEMSNKYHIVNFNLGETRVVDEGFIDDLIIAKSNINSL